ncbi:hypothetical protein ABK040_007940 [Willaertia magna]
MSPNKQMLKNLSQQLLKRRRTTTSTNTLLLRNANYTIGTNTTFQYKTITTTTNPTINKHFHINLLFQQYQQQPPIEEEETILEYEEEEEQQLINEVFVDDFLLRDEQDEEDSINKNKFFPKGYNYLSNKSKHHCDLITLNKIKELLGPNDENINFNKINKNECKEIQRNLRDMFIFNSKINEKIILDFILNIKDKYNGNLPTKTLYFLLINFYIERKCDNIALDLFNYFKDKDDLILNTGAAIHARLKNIKEVEDIILNKVKNINQQHYATLIHGYLNINNLDKALEIVNILNNMLKKVNSDVLTPLLSYYIKNNDVDAALKLFNEIPNMGITRSLSTYNVMLSMSIQTNNHDLVNIILKQLKLDNQFKLNPGIYSHIIFYYFRNKNYDMVVNYYKQMKEHNIEIPIHSFHFLLIAVSKKKLLDEIKYLEKIIIEKTGGTIFAVDLLYAYSTVKELKEAERIFYYFKDLINKPKEIEKFYHVMLSTYLYFHKDVKAFSLLERFPFEVNDKTIEVLLKETKKQNYQSVVMNKLKP